MAERNGNRVIRSTSVLIFCALFQLASAQQPADTTILVGLSKPSYKLKKKVKINLFNQSKDTIRFYPEFGYLSMNIEKKDISGWERIDALDIYNYTPHTITFAPGLNTQYSWDQTMIDRANWPQRKTVTEGIYRVNFIFWKDCTNSVPQIEGENYCKYFITYSNPFSIKGSEFISKHQMGFDAVPNYTQQAAITDNGGNAKLSSSPSFGIEGGPSYRYSLSKRLGLKTGIKIGVLPFEMQFTLDSTEFGLTEDVSLDTTRHSIIYYTVPLLLEYHFVIRKSAALFCAIGAQIRQYPSKGFQVDQSYSNTDTTEIKIFELTVEVDPAKRIALNYNLAMGYTGKIGRGTFNIGLVANIGLNSKIFNGTYWFDTATEYTKGTYNVSTNYAGVAVSYMVNL